MIDLRDQTSLTFGPSPEIPNNRDYTKLRKAIYDKLLEAQELLPKGIKFCLYEGYRSLDLQEKLFTNHYNQIKDRNSLWNHQQLFNETTKLVAPLINLDGSQNIPPHSTGSAIDIYLIDSKGEPLDMGLLIKDWMKDPEGFYAQTDSTMISQEAKRNRKIMSQALTEVGFVNYPTEYWHWSYGDRYWAYHKNEDYAIYGSVK